MAKFFQIDPSNEIYLNFQLKDHDRPTSAIKASVNSLLKKLGMFEKRDAFPHELSGGQKRRLCLGMALIGDATVIAIHF